MPTRYEPWPDGTPCWVDCQVDDAAKAKEFYTALFGWEIHEGTEETGGYMMALNDGRPAAGIAQKPEGVPMPSTWSSYIASSDADAAFERAKAAGATFAMEAIDVMDFGRMTFGDDPTGAAFGIWQANQHNGVAVYNEPGALAWNELHTRDVNAATAFYTAVFGWEYDDISNPDRTYVICKRPGDDDGIGGIYLDTMMPADVPANWLVWFAVAHCDECTTKATELDGTVLMPPSDSPLGRMSVVQGAQGEAFGLIDLTTTVDAPPAPT